MNRRIRTSRRDEQSFNKYLKPGALAQIRDSKISARSQKPSLSTQIAMYRLVTPSSPTQTPPTTNLQNQISLMNNGFPCFTGRRFFSPRCPQRKKLVAAKSFYFSPSSPTQPDSPDSSLLDLLNNDFLVAH